MAHLLSWWALPIESPPLGDPGVAGAIFVRAHLGPIRVQVLVWLLYCGPEFSKKLRGTLVFTVIKNNP